MVKHKSVGAIIKRNNQYLLINRRFKPLGWAGIAGHLDNKESPEEALVREVREESNLEVIRYKKLFERFLSWNVCVQNVKGHYWYLYSCKTKGKLKISHEAKDSGWFAKDQIKNLKLEKIWKYWFNKLGVLR